MDDDPQALLVAEGQALHEALATHVPRWGAAVVIALVEAYFRRPASDDERVVATAAGEATWAAAEPGLSSVLRYERAGSRAARPADATSTPLSVLRGATGPLADALHALGVAEVHRDPQAQRLEPTDVYAIGPAAWADLGEVVAEAGIRWGAAKALVHLRSRR